MAQCERLRLTCAGDSLPELRVHIAQTLDRLLRQHVAVGSLDAFVREHGWTAPSDGAPPSQATQFYLPCGLIHDVLLGVGH